MATAFYYPVLLASLIVISSCAGSKDSETPPPTDPIAIDSGDASGTTEEKYDYVISNIPIPFDILDRLYKSGVKFRKEHTNPTGNISKYLQNHSKALNLGIYGADLTYTICFEQFNELNPYLKNAKKLADDLGIPLAFNKETLDKYSGHKENKDSLRNAVYESYNEVDKSLKSNERIGLAALVVTGGWIEGLYITSATSNDENLSPETKKELRSIMRRQHFHLDNIINLLNDFSSDAYFQNMANELKAIQQVYASRIKKNELSDEEAARIREMITALRTRVIEGI